MNAMRNNKKIHDRVMTESIMDNETCCVQKQLTFCMPDRRDELYIGMQAIRCHIESIRAIRATIDANLTIILRHENPDLSTSAR